MSEISNKKILPGSLIGNNLITQTEDDRFTSSQTAAHYLKSLKNNKTMFTHYMKFICQIQIKLVSRFYNLQLVIRQVSPSYSCWVVCVRFTYGNKALTVMYHIASLIHICDPFTISNINTIWWSAIILLQQKQIYLADVM